MHRLLAIAAIAVAALVAGPFRAADAGGVEVPVAEDLAAVSGQAREGRLPVMLMFSASYCPYCDLLEEEIVRPMLISGDYTDKVIIRKVVVDSYADLRDFDGADLGPGELARRYRVPATPTLVFVDHQGRELAGRIVGINTVELFGGRVDLAIERSLALLRGAKPQRTADASGI